MAEVRIPSGQSTIKHFHKKTEEVYYILSGRGQLYLEDESQAVAPGDVIIILPRQQHKIVNKCKQDLVMLVACSPAYTDEDQILSE